MDIDYDMMECELWEYELELLKETGCLPFVFDDTWEFFDSLSEIEGH